jgi:hypothetical protein
MDEKKGVRYLSIALFLGHWRQKVNRFQGRDVDSGCLFLQVAVIVKIWMYSSCQFFELFGNSPSPSILASGQ